MEIISVLAIISGIIILGFISEFIFKKTNIPDVLILILIGIVIGSVLKWIKTEEFGFGAELFTTFALIFILFQGAINLDFRTILKNLPKTLKLTILSFFATVIVVTIISYFLKYDLLTAILIGTILAGTSSAVVIPLVSNLDLKEKYGSVLTLESAISDVLCIVGTITILEIMNTGAIVASGIFKKLLSSFSLAVVVGLIVGLIWIVLMRKNEHILKSPFVTIAVVMALFSFVESSFVEASGAIAVLIFGLIIGNSKSLYRLGNGKKSEEENLVRNVLIPSTKSFYSEISFFVKTFFFVYLGIMMDFSNMWSFVFGSILIVGIYLVRPFVVDFVFNDEVYEDESERTLLEIIIPKGLAAAILSGIAVQSGLLKVDTGNFINLILSVIFLSIVLTSVLIFLSEKGWFKGFIPFLHKNNLVPKKTKQD